VGPIEDPGLRREIRTTGKGSRWARRLPPPRQQFVDQVEPLADRHHLYSMKRR
jgi:hypothetical protein